MSGQLRVAGERRAGVDEQLLVLRSPVALKHVLAAELRPPTVGLTGRRRKVHAVAIRRFRCSGSELGESALLAQVERRPACARGRPNWRFLPDVFAERIVDDLSRQRLALALQEVV